MEEELFGLLASAVATLGLELVELDVRSGVVKVVVDRPGGADVDLIARATRAVSVLLDSHDPQPGRRYTLEVSSPGIERPLRTPGQFARAVGQTVSVRTLEGGQGERRIKGTLRDADDEGVVLEGESLPDDGLRLTYAQIERARTVFEWPRPARPVRSKRSEKRLASSSSASSSSSSAPQERA